MGQKHSKTGDHSLSGHSLSEEEINEVKNLFKAKRRQPVDYFKEKWDNMLTPEICEYYLDYLSKQSPREKNSTCSEICINVFEKFYGLMLRGSAEDVSPFLEVLLKDDSENSKNSDGIPLPLLIKYLKEFLSSVIKVMDAKKIEPYRLCVEKNIAVEDESLECWVAFLIESMTISEEHSGKTEEKCAQSRDVRRWLDNNNAVIRLHSFLWKCICVGEKEGQILTGCPLPTFDLPKNCVSALNAYSFMFLNTNLPIEYGAKWRLLYSTSKDGRSFSKLISNISNQGPTVFIIRDTEDYIFGSFASTSWNANPKFYGDDGCFLFTLNPKMNVYRGSSRNDHYMYMNVNQKTLPNGVGMGGQFDYWGLYIDSDFEGGKCSAICLTYENYKMLSNSENFSIHSLEVWGVGEKPSVNENDDEEECGERSVLTKDPTGRAMLDMLGKTGSGREFLEHPKIPPDENDCS